MGPRLLLPLPPSVNSAYRNVTVNKRIKTEATKAYMIEAAWLAKKWVRETGWIIPAAGQKVIMRLWFSWPDQTKRDTHNREKVLLDALEGILYVDDCFVLVQEQDYSIDKHKPRVEIELEVREEKTRGGASHSLTTINAED